LASPLLVVSSPGHFQIQMHASRALAGKTLTKIRKESSPEFAGSALIKKKESDIPADMFEV
jgi:hypothetical protein